jgi:hypothetical protein
MVCLVEDNELGFHGSGKHIYQLSEWLSEEALCCREVVQQNQKELLLACSKAS